MRALRPDRLLVLQSGLWAVDAVQPVAAVLDPAGAGVRQVVSWAQLPPPGGAGALLGWPPRRVLGNGTSLWVQQEPSGALVRVDPDGLGAAVWTDGLALAVCGPEVAWCAAPLPAQELVTGADASPVRQLGPDRLLRVDADGRATPVRTEHPVRSVRAEAEALLVQVDVEGWTLHHLGTDLYEVIRPTRWMALPWEAEVPQVLTLAEHGLPARPARAPRDEDGGRGPFVWYDPDRALDPDHEDDAAPAGAGVLAGGLRWHLGWALDQPAGRAVGNGARRQVVASAHRLDGGLVRRWHLGAGTATAATPLGDRLAIVVDRSPWRLQGGPSRAEVVALHPAEPEPLVLLGDGAGVDVTSGCWPLVARPLEADSYAAQVLAANSSVQAYWHSAPDGHGGTGEERVHPLAEGMSGARTALVGEWPGTRLEWTFAFAPYPGLLLRRRVPLFDELGRPFPPVHADIHLMEDLETRDLPSASDARDGVLDV